MNERPQPRRAAAASVGLAAVLGLAACASTPDPLVFEEGLLVLAEAAGPAARPGDVARALLTTDPQFVLIRGPADSAWFASVAEESGLILSGPSVETGLGFAFLSGAEALGDTTLAIPVGDSGAFVIHDALYELAEGVFLDLIAFRADDTPDPHALIQAFLAYVATDVMTSAPLVLGIQASDPMLADSIEVLLRPSFRPPTECEGGGASSSPADLSGLRVFVGTPAQITCQEASQPPGDPNGLLLRLLPHR